MGICNTHLFYRAVFDPETFPLRKKPSVDAGPSSLEPVNGQPHCPQHPLVFVIPISSTDLCLIPKLFHLGKTPLWTRDPLLNLEPMNGQPDCSQHPLQVPYNIRDLPFQFGITVCHYYVSPTCEDIQPHIIISLALFGNTRFSMKFTEGSPSLGANSDASVRFDAA